MDEFTMVSMWTFPGMTWLNVPRGIYVNNSSETTYVSTNAKILIVADVNISAEGLKQVLVEQGYVVQGVVGFGEAFLEKTVTEKPDLILVDISPGGCFDRVKVAEEAHRIFDIPVIYLTSDADDDTIQRTMLGYPFAYLIKPFDSARLHYAIEIALVQHQFDDQLKKSESRFRAIFESSGAAMIISENNGIISMVNDEFTYLSGYSKEELEYKKCWTEFFQENELKDMENFQRISGNDTACIPSNYMATFMDKGFCAKNVYTNVTVIPDTGTCIVSMIDITNLKKAEEKILKLNSELTKVNEDLTREITERKKVEIRLKHQASHDSLTGLPNRDLFFDRLTQAFAFEKRHKNYLALMLLDLDNFKKINDTQGHLSGDMLLKEVAKRLQQCMRQYDTVARFGGDEFVIIANNMTDIHDIVKFAEKVTRLFRQPFDIFGKSTSITISLGVAIYPIHGATVEELLKMADVAMYQAKAAGKNAFRLYYASMSLNIDERTLMREKLHLATEREEFLPHYQPRVNAASGKITGMEALLRWQPPGAPLVFPSEFFDLLEDSGLIVPVGERLLFQVCRQTKAWQDAGLPPLRIAVKISMLQFQQDNFPEKVAEVLAATGLEPRYLELELTENIIMEDFAESMRKLRNLKEIGIMITIDNFGTGYSSLSNLNLLPIDVLKIDRSIVNGITSDPSRAIVVSATIAMGHSLGKLIVAEGVESEDQHEFLARHKCEKVQGYFFSRPVNSDEFERLVSSAMPLGTTFH